jgi:hypothetical protein
MQDVSMRCIERTTIDDSSCKIISVDSHTPTMFPPRTLPIKYRFRP